MTLRIDRSQEEQKSMLGRSKGVRFSFGAKLELTEEEKAIRAKYQRPDDPQDEVISQLLAGTYYGDEEIGSVLEQEEHFKKVCAAYKNRLDAMSTYLDGETVEF